MKRFIILALLGVGVILCMVALNYAGNRANWEFSALNIYDWLPVLSAMFVLYGLAALTIPPWRLSATKGLEVLFYMHIGLFIFELWQNSASFPPMSIRQYFVEITKLSFIFITVGFSIYSLRKLLITTINL